MPRAVKVALTLSDSFCVLRHRGTFLDLIATSVDVLFANETRSPPLTRWTPSPRPFAACRVSARSPRSTHGATGHHRYTYGVHEIAAHPVAAVVDTTGAGDLDAAGFLDGLTDGRDLPTCGAAREPRGGRGDLARGRTALEMSLAELAAGLGILASHAP